MNPITNIDDAIKLIESYEGEAEDFTLPISDKLNDSVGINMAIITDAILAKGWEPVDFVQEDGYRLYSYQEM